MTAPPQEGCAAALPLAMAALDVAGQMRERSPTDLAVFGAGSARLTERFLEPATGQQLLARVVAEGSAEAAAWLQTAAGPRRFRVALWRARGGERIRILAAFAAIAEGAAPAADTLDADIPDMAREAVLRLGRELRTPIEAVMGFSELLRADPAGLTPEQVSAHASDVLAAAWRMMRLTSDLLAAAVPGGVQPPLHVAEVDIARLARRIAGLAAPAARSAGVTIRTGGLPEPGHGPLLLGDESTLWSALDALLQNALRHCGRGATVVLGLVPGAGGPVLEISDDGPGIAADRLAGLLAAPAEVGGVPRNGLAVCRALARANGAELELESGPERGLTARVVFPAARCLDPV